MKKKKYPKVIIRNTILFVILSFLIYWIINLIFPNKISNNKNLDNFKNTTNTNAIKITDNTFNTNSVGNNTQTHTEEVKNDSTITMTVIGDIMCHNTQFQDAYNSSTDTYDFSYVFSDVKDYISSADISIGNLETTFAGKSRGYSGYPTFNTPSELATNLKELGIDVLSTANNHCMDKGYSGLVSTIEKLDEVGISHTGTFSSAEKQNEILYKDINGIKIAFLSYTYGTNGINIASDKSYSVNLIDKSLIKKHIDLAKNENPDIICVSMHWGIEYKLTPTKEQEDLADFLFENGVDIILGSHPHVLEPMEKRTISLSDGSTKEGFIIYSLGNFISGQVKENTRDSIILNLKITKNGKTGKISIDDYSYIPIYMYKGTSGKKYKLLDINKYIENYGTKNSSINSTTYSTLQTELKKITNILK